MFAAECFAIDKEKLKVDEKELKRRLSVSKDFDISVFDTAVERVIAESSPKACFVKVPVSADGNGVEFPFGRVESRDIAKNLCGCKEAFVFAVTLGHGVERLLSKMSHLSAADFFVYDAIGSALAESVCDEAEKIIKGDIKCKPRFSPGYGDFPLSCQRDILNVLDSSRKIGLCLNDSLIMSPSKSVTGIIGISDVPSCNRKRGCSICEKKDCIYRDD
jgi:hypothetical protein